MKEFYLTQTSLKDLENEQTCPWRWKEQWLEGNIPFKTSEAMDKGSYFEWLVLGSGAIAGTEVTDLPRLKSGEKSTEQLRIEAQAARVKRMLTDPNDPEYLGMAIINTQLELKHENDKGTADIELKDENGHPWLLETKLTKDATSDYSKFGYGNNWEDLDLIQLVHYGDMYYKRTGVFPRCGLLVADYTPQKRVIFGEIVISEGKIVEKTMRFEAGHTTIDLYNKHGWVKTPNIQECESCPLKCNERMSGSKLIKKTINY